MKNKIKMNEKFYVSLEAARLLKEKGYDERCDYVYAPDGRIISLKMLSNWSDDYLSAPTKAEAMDWIESNIGFIISEDRRCDGLWYYVIFQGNDIWYDSDCHDNGVFLTRWEAEEAAIIKACELLTNEN